MTTTTKCKVCGEDYVEQEPHGLLDCVKHLGSLVNDHDAYLDFPDGNRPGLEAQIAEIVDRIIDCHPKLGITEERCEEIVDEKLEDTSLESILEDALTSSRPTRLSRKLKDIITERVEETVSEMLTGGETTDLDRYLARAIDNRVLRLDQLLRDLQKIVLGHHPQ